MRQAELEKREEGIRIGGIKVNNLRYADDTTFQTENDKDLKVLLKKVKEASMKAGLALNLKNTKVMSTQDIRGFKIDDENVEVVEKMCFSDL